MKPISFLKHLFSFALLGCVLTGATIGFFIQGDNLEVARGCGTIMGIILFLFFQKHPKK